MSAGKVVSLTLTDQEGGSAVAEVRLKDGRLFSILAATPEWFSEQMSRLGLRFYFGPSVLFVRRISEPLLRKAADAMAKDADRWFTRYDTPRTTLPRVLAAFKDKHP